MKKLFSVLAVLFVMGTANVFAATGVGLQGGPTIGSNVTASGALTFKLDALPCVFAISVPSFDPMTVGITADWWIANPKIERNWGWFYGVGLSGAVRTGDNATFGFGGRALVGTNFFFLNKFLELYIQAAWNPMLWIDNGVKPVLVNFPIDLGFRFWF